MLIKWHKYISTLSIVLCNTCADGILQSSFAQQVIQETSQTQKMSEGETEDLKRQLKLMEESLLRQQEQIKQMQELAVTQQEQMQALKNRIDTVSTEAATPVVTTPVAKEEIKHAVEDYLSTDEARGKMGLGWSSVASATNDERSPDTLKYALSFKSPDEKYSWNFGARMQVRYTFRDRDEDVGESDVQDINLRRARVYFGGNIYSKILHYYVELDADKFNPALRDFYTYFTPLEELNVKIGYFKVPFNRQRMATSAKLLLQDRSIASEEFDQKRDTGLDIYGNPLDGHIEYHAAVFQGAGEKFSGIDNTDNKLMYVLSLRCNPFGKYDYYDETDLKYSDTLALTIGTSVVFNAKVADAKLPNTDTMAGTVDLGVKYKGLSWNNEYYIRSEDPDIGATARSDGFFTQVGYFVLPKKLEVAARYSMVDPNKDVSNDIQKEYTGGVNYYFRRHRSKIQADFGQYVTSEGNMPDKKEHRIRLQYQIIF